MHRLLIFLATAASAAEFFVSPKGDDTSPGTLTEPFATLTRARDEARKHRDEPRTITLLGGLYELPKGFALGAEDSGTAWQAAAGEKPLLVGGTSVSGWKAGRDGIMEADLAALGVKEVKQLFFDGRRQPLARYPNFDPQNPYGGGWAYADGVMWPMYVENPDEDKHTLAVKPENWRTWEHPEDVEVFSFPRYNWWNDLTRVKSVDSEKHAVTLARDGSYAMRGNDRYYFQGALEDLDAAGEWHFDRRTHTLYFKPPAELKSPVTIPTTRDILKIDGAENVTIRGLTFECADGSAITLTKTNHCRVLACTIRNVGDFGGNGVNVNGGTDNGIVGCDIHDTGRSGVSLSGGDRKTLTGAGNFVDNCYIHHVGIFYKQGVGVALDGVGQRVSHCLIHDTPRFAIQFAGNAHVLEYNHLRHLALETEDVGATYCGGRDWISPRGTVIRYNFIHDVLGYGWNGKWTSPYFAWGIYLDDNSGGVDVIGNIVARCGRSCMHGHSARDCRVENNVFIEGGMRQWEFNGWTTQHRFWTSMLGMMTKGYESVVNEPAWRFMRGMQFPPADIPDAEGRVMSGNNFQRNIIAWHNDESLALNVVAFNADRNTFDHNLYWHDGKPLKTGQHKAGKVIGGNLVPNPQFTGAGPDILPELWAWQIHPPGATAGVIEDGGHTALRIAAAFDHTKERDNYPIVGSREIELKPGASFRLHAKLRSDHAGAKAALMLQCWIPPHDGKPAHFWSHYPSEVKLTTTWQDYEFAFRIPAPGEKGWRKDMKKFSVRLDWPAEAGALFAADVVLEETETLDEWQSWQAMGGDRHSVIADPKFIAPEKDDYRLAPDSPAFALGFQPIPVEKIGPYASDDRATWPIVEAEGAREHPLSP